MNAHTPKIEMRAVESLRPYAGNARRHSKVQMHQIADSIERFGFTNPVLISDDGEVPSVLHLAKSLGINQGDISRILPLGLLAPDIVAAILTGRQPVELTTRRLKRLADLPIS